MCFLGQSQSYQFFFSSFYHSGIIHIDITDKIIIFSGRCSSEMMMKLGRMGISTVAAKSVPTTLSLALAKKLGITLVARMAPGSFCVYTNPQRIIC